MSLMRILGGGNYSSGVSPLCNSLFLTAPNTKLIGRTMAREFRTYTLTDNQFQEAVELYNKGYSLWDVSGYFGVSQSFLNKLFADKNIPRRKVRKGFTSRGLEKLPYREYIDPRIANVVRNENAA